MALLVGDWVAHCVLSFSEKTGKHQTEIGVLLWVRLTKLEKAKTMKAIMALQVGDWAAHCVTIDYDTTNVSQMNNQDLC